MAETAVPIRFVYRSASMIPLLTIMQGRGLWEREGLDVRHMEFTQDPAYAEERLFAGDIDFIFGNHVSPYLRLSQGHPIVCLAQSTNWMQTWIATSPDVTELSMLKGKRVLSKPLFLPDGKFSGHNWGNYLLMLELNGVKVKEDIDYLDPDEIEALYQGSSSAEKGIAAVKDGRASACFINTERGAAAEAAGLRVHRLPETPMIHSITLTTTTPRVQKDSTFAERIIKALLEAVHIFKTDRETTLALLANPVQPLGDRYVERLRDRYDHYAGEYDSRLLPRAEAILNVHKLACLAYPGSEKVNPMELWDLHYLRQILDSGYVDRMYGKEA
jgi:ABC-type nitrate/sulfonate/bicarbonate transport system substrate-binding protein